MIDDIIKKAFENQEGRLFYILTPEETVGNGAENLFKIGEAKGKDLSALAGRISAINYGTRPNSFAENGWARGKWKAVKAWSFDRFGVPKEIEHLVSKVLVQMKHESVGKDYFIGDVDQAIHAAQRVIRLLPETAEPQEISLTPTRGENHQLDPWGSRFDSGAHVINLLLAASEFPMTISEIERRSNALADEIGLTARRAVRNHVHKLRDENRVKKNDNHEWQATDRARMLWKAEE
ncbi:hypothetical protein HFP89_08010 [Wenzhouxiangella sp. XN79A]|uniref:hypothetical protein n=1 Tax=Wenzhouxiangella sp. XN79A TaxID=2724193 RepID=UPI00144AB828|nr:hypothetical protein [Wenzhouxiangella sp. XN79A]NKI35108.1 hypothetical protein [Wenzhouxiangella sp. XN79A]